MKLVVLSADGDSKVYAVPDPVAEYLEEYCLEFCDCWLKSSPDAERYRINGVLCYDEEDFIKYLNQWIFPDQPSRLVENLGWLDFDQPLPALYRDCPRFCF